MLTLETLREAAGEHAEYLTQDGTAAKKIQVFTSFDARCPFCRRKHLFTASHLIPRQLADCRCGAVAEIRPIRQTAAAKFWAVEWSIGQ